MSPRDMYSRLRSTRNIDASVSDPGASHYHKTVYANAHPWNRAALSDLSKTIPRLEVDHEIVTRHHSRHGGRCDVFAGRARAGVPAGHDKPGRFGKGYNCRIGNPDRHDRIKCNVQSAGVQAAGS